MYSTTFTQKDQQASDPPSAFPLEAYGTPTPGTESSHANKSTPNHVNDHPTTSGRRPKNLYSIIRLSFLTILNIWAYSVVTTDLLKVACFNNVVSLGSTQAKILCDHISPSFPQFWWKILEPQTSFTEQVPTYLDTQVSHLQESLCRRVIAKRRRDFALRGAGAFVLLDLTTPTFKSPHPNQIYDNFNHPSIVLEEQLIIGDCWEFSGSVGHIGIYLSEKINITEITVNYVHPTLISRGMMKKAPRSVTVWALTDPGHGQIPASGFRKPTDFSSTKRLPPLVQPEQIFVPILEAEYLVAFDPDILVQTFPVAPIDCPPSQIIVVEINSNWGSPTTCLHHLSIHGIPDDVLL